MCSDEVVDNTDSLQNLAVSVSLGEYKLLALYLFHSLSICKIVL